MSGIHDHCVGESGSAGGWNIAFVVPVVMHSRANVESLPAMVGPSGPLPSPFMNDEGASPRGKWVLVEVKWAVYLCIGG